MSRKKYKDVIEEIEKRNNREKGNDATKVGQLVLMMINVYIYIYICCPQKEKKIYIHIYGITRTAHRNKKKE